MYKINPPQNNIKEGVQETPQFLLNSFVCLLLGPPQSGKTHLIQQLISDERFYGGKFDQILFIGPSLFNKLDQDQTNTIKVVDPKYIQKVISSIAAQIQYQDYNLLLVMDDIVSQLKGFKQAYWKTLFYNRRHLLRKNQKRCGTISILITSQKYNQIPTSIRNCINCTFIFKCNLNDLDSYMKQAVLKQDKKLLTKKVIELKKYQFVYHNKVDYKFYNHQFKDIFSPQCFIKAIKRVQDKQSTASFKPYSKQSQRQQFQQQPCGQTIKYQKQPKQIIRQQILQQVNNNNKDHDLINKILRQ